MPFSPSYNTTNPGAAVSNREDLTDILKVLAPEDTPIYSSLPHSKAKGTYHEWTMDTLASPSTDGVIEGSDVDSFADKFANRVRVGNYVQKLRRSYMVSDIQEAVDSVGPAKYAQAEKKAGLELKRDIEATLLSTNDRVAGDSNTASKLRGLGDWIDSAGPSDVPADYRTPADSIHASGSFTETVLNNRSPYVTNTYESEYLIEVIYGYQRLIDKEDNAEGIYCTVFHRDFDTKSIEESGNSVQPYAKHELLNGYEDYPIVVTRLSEGTKCLYDTQTMPELLKGIQWQVKTERDSRADRNSMSTLPPLMHPVGNAPQDWGPGRKVPYRRGGEFHFGPAPAFDPGSNEMETTMTKLADSLVGLNSEDPLSAVKRQFIIDKFLGHVQAVIKMAYTCFQRFGPDSVAFRVMGVPEGQQFDKGNPEEDFDIMIGYDVLNTDPEMQEKKLQQLVSLVQLDRNGRIDMDKLLDVIASSIDPMLADAILQPAEQAQQQTVKHVTDDLTNIFAGIEKPARPNGAQVAMQVIQQYAQQPDIQQRISSDEAFKEKLEKYYKQYEFQIQQAQNAQIGKIGTAPASMGNVDTQSIQ
jgi:hypothetical protein